MNHFEQIIGNRLLTDRLSRDIDEGSLSHAYILEGPKGSGRHTIALTAVAALSCKNRENGSKPYPCGECINCRKIFSGQAPDIMTIGLDGDRATIGIEAIRKIKNDIYTAPNSLDVKVYIIDDADYLTVQAQNAFLLSLEEPPSYILFFLICENSASLLETVRSRAPALRTEHLSAEIVEKYILEHDKRAVQLKNDSPDEFAALLCVSSGSIGYALELLDPKKRKQIIEYRSTAKKLISLLASPNRADIFSIIASFGNRRQDICRQLVFVQFALRDLLLLKKSDDAPLCFFEDRDSALELATHITSKRILALYDASVTTIEDMERNANIRLSLMNMMHSANLI